jgi:hypothetical protein
MHRSARLAAAGLALLPLLAAPALAQETEPKSPKREKPLVWAAIRSYGRLEQRLREHVELAKRPGFEKVLLGSLEMQLGGLGGLDKERPIHAALAAPNILGVPRVVVTLPVADQAAAEKSLRSIFPETIAEGDALRLQGGPTNLAARFEAADATLRIGLTIDALTTVDATLPEGLWENAGGPDLVVHWDADETRNRYADVWKEVRNQWAQAVEEARRQLDESAGDSSRAPLLAATDQVSRAILCVADDFAGLELRLTLAPDGWETVLAARMRPGSASATFLGQIGRPVGALPPPAPDAWIHAEGAWAMTGEIQTALRNGLSGSIKKDLEEVATRTDLTNEQRRVERDKAERVLRLLENWIAQPAMGLSIDLIGSPRTPRIEASILRADAPAALEDWLALLPLTDHRVDRDVAKHGETAVHRFAKRSPTPAADPSSPAIEALYASAEKGCIHVGAAPESVKRLLDRQRVADGKTSPSDTALARLDLYLGRYVQANGTDVLDSANPALGQALVKQPAENEQPIRLELKAAGGSATFRLAIPGSLIRLVMEEAGTSMAPSEIAAPEPEK